MAPPLGATVDSLPDGAASETGKGTAYSVYASTYYRPFCSGSDVVYMVVEKPGRHIKEELDIQSPS